VQKSAALGYFRAAGANAKQAKEADADIPMSAMAPEEIGHSREIAAIGDQRFATRSPVTDTKNSVTASDATTR